MTPSFFLEMLRNFNLKKLLNTLAAKFHPFWQVVPLASPFPRINIDTMKTRDGTL